ncbi:MAG: transposase [Candidatus Omnitrophica bacterium]|nr:transposase [Candidatus Omnitrophota bacterium]
MTGVLITDFLSAYNKIAAKKQRCLLHLLRDLSKVLEFWDREDKGVIRYARRLVKILKDGIKLYDEHRNKEWDEEYIRRRKRIVESLEDFRFPDPNKKILNRIAKRLERHKNEIFTIFYVKDIESHNNRAEREIRPGVIRRKITYGNRSEQGARYHSVLMSVIQTAKLNGMDVLDTLKTILLCNDNPFAGIVDSS